MAQRGRKSKAELVAATTGVTQIAQRPEPAEDLTEEQKAEWVRIVENLPATWFPDETLSMLAQLCRHTCDARYVAGLIQRFKDSGSTDAAELDKLTKMQDRESRAIMSLQTKMRISQQSTQDQWTKKSSGPRKPSWVN